MNACGKGVPGKQQASIISTLFKLELQAVPTLLHEVRVFIDTCAGIRVQDKKLFC